MSNDNHNPPSKVSAAFVEAWSTIRTLGHDAKNNHIGNKYTSYDKVIRDLREILNNHDLAVSQQPVPHDDHASIQTVLRHKDGGTIDLGTIAVPLKRHAEARKDNPPQAYGSALTYAKRYGLCAAFGIPTGEDDDAHGVGNSNQQQPKQDTKAAAMGAIASWAGLAGDDLKQAASMVMGWAGAKAGDPETPAKIIAYVEKHKQEDFIEHSKGKDS